MNTFTPGVNRECENTRASDELIRELVETVESLMEAVRGGWQKHELKDDWELAETSISKAKEHLQDINK